MADPLFIGLYEASCPACDATSYRLLQVRDLRKEQQRIARFAFGEVKLVAQCYGNWRTLRNILSALGQPEGGAIHRPLGEIYAAMQRCAEGAEMVRGMQAEDSPTPDAEQEATVRRYATAVIASRDQGGDYVSLARMYEQYAPGTLRLLEEQGVSIEQT